MCGSFLGEGFKRFTLWHISTLTLTGRKLFYILGSELKDDVTTHNPKPGGDPGVSWLWFWKAAFPQSFPAISEQAWVSLARPKIGLTGRSGSMIMVLSTESSGERGSLPCFSYVREVLYATSFCYWWVKTTVMNGEHLWD